MTSFTLSLIRTKRVNCKPYYFALVMIFLQLSILCSYTCNKNYLKTWNLKSANLRFEMIVIGCFGQRRGKDVKWVVVNWWRREWKWCYGIVRTVDAWAHEEERGKKDQNCLMLNFHTISLSNISVVDLRSNNLYHIFNN
jgi:hypothetical protein